MSGIDIYKKYISQRDFSSSPSDQYAQLLQTLFYHLQDALFPILEKAEMEGKRISLSRSSHSDDEYTTDNIILS